jgi:Ca2+-binding EF-hand superfamily protein
VPFDDRALVLLMHHLDSTGDGKVNYAEFAEALGH